MSNHHKMQNIVKELNNDENIDHLDRIYEHDNGWRAEDERGDPLRDTNHKAIVFPSVLAALLALKEYHKSETPAPYSNALIAYHNDNSDKNAAMFNSIWHECHVIEPGELMNIELDLPTPYSETRLSLAEPLLNVVRGIESKFRYMAYHARKASGVTSRNVDIDVEFRRSTVMLTLQSKD